MTRDELTTLILATLGDIAPELELDSVDPARDLRDQLDIDSMDFLNLVIALHEKLAIDIPEADYPNLATLDGAAAYLEARSAGKIGATG